MKHESDKAVTVWVKETVNSLTGKTKRKSVRLALPTLGELIETDFAPRKHLLFPWLREQESVMLYADTGVGKSLFALSMALAVAGGGEFLGWRPEEKPDGAPWRVLYLDGEMHAQDIQERALMLLEAIPGIERDKALANIRFLPRQLQDPGTDFPCLTDAAGMNFLMQRVEQDRLDLVILDNFTTLGEVEDENAASSFNGIQDFLLSLKTTGVATVLVHHANKAGDNFRGSSKLAATFETIVHLVRPEGHQQSGEAAFRVEWDKVRAGGPKRTVRAVMAKLTSTGGESFGEPERATWEYEAGELDRLEELQERLKAGDFMSLSEAATFYGTSRMSLSRWKDKGIRLGLWTEEKIHYWLGKGKRLRGQGKTQPPAVRVACNEIWDETEETSEEVIADF